LSEQVHLSKLAAGHLAAIALLEQQALSPWSERQIGAELAAANHIGLVAAVRGASVGWCCSRFCGTEAELLKMTVAGPYRRRGIGRLLAAELERRLVDCGAATLLLEVRAASDGAIAFYRSAGFQLVGRRPRYYCDPQDDALLMRKVIGQGRDST
jgi:ribosomal-protein-alanine N-acetyltransferase